MVRDVCRDNFIALLLPSVVILSGCSPWVTVQNSRRTKVYACVPAIGSYTVGAENKTTGVFWKYIDDTTWNHIGPPNLKAFAVAPMKTDSGDILYVAAGNGIHRVMNEGKTWQQRSSWKERDVLHVITKGDTIYCGTAYGLISTLDRLNSLEWGSPEGEVPKFVTGLIASASGVLFASSEEGVFRGEYGYWWTQISSIERVRSIHETRAGSALYIITESGEVLASKDYGRTWVRRSSGLPRKPLYAIQSDPKNAKILYTGGFQTGIYCSIDSGLSWIKSGLQGKTIHAITVAHDLNSIVVGTTGDGVYQSDDAGTTWRFVGLSGANIWSLTID